MLYISCYIISVDNYIYLCYNIAMNTKRIWNTFKDFTAIDSPSFSERQFCDALIQKLTALNVKVSEDNVSEIIGGNCNNLYGSLNGTISGTPILLSAHMDTVEPSRNKNAILHEDGLITSDGSSVLGADDVAGISIILEAIERLQETNTPHRDIELLFPVAEEPYGAGSFNADYSKLSAKTAYVLDLTGAIGEAANSAPSIIGIKVKIYGKAAHAGFAPHEGIHAISVAAKAIAKLPLGQIDNKTTCNIGVIHGGELRNIVPDYCELNGEIRSLDHTSALHQLEIFTSIFQREADLAGATAEVKYKIEIQAYETPLNSEAVQRYKRACESINVQCNLHPTLGGSDNNNFALHGIQGLVIACSMHNVHSVRETSRLDELEQCVQLVINLLTDNS